MLTTYTTNDEIRAALGVAEEEIEDVVLALPNYELVLSFDLEDLGVFSPTIEATFLTLIDTTATPSPSVNEARFVSILKVYAAYVIARHLLRTLAMFAPQTIKDSKTELQRVSDPYENVRAGVESFYQLMQVRLLKAFGVLFPSITLPTVPTLAPLTAVGLAADPVLGN